MIYKVDENFEITNINPFTNLPYDNTWIIYQLTNSKEYQMLNGGYDSVYVLKVSKQHFEWKMSVFDFIEYQETYDKNVILSISNDDYAVAKNHYVNHHYNDKFLRDYEPGVLVHSTTQENWGKIKIDGCLKSWNILKMEKPDFENEPIGKALGDPTDFSDFIMFSGGGISNEIVVLSKQKGIITMDENMQYETGVRLYFDIEKIAKDGLLVRDGCHLKVKDKLPLEQYLLWVGDWNSVGLTTNISTPKEFTELSNSTFKKLFNKKLEI